MASKRTKIGAGLRGSEGFWGKYHRIFEIVGSIFAAIVLLTVISKKMASAQDKDTRDVQASAIWEESDASAALGIQGIMDGVESVYLPRFSGTSFETILVGRYTESEEDGLQKVPEDNVASYGESLQSSSKILAEATIMSDKDYQTFLDIVQAEAGTEDLESKILVANVILNRVKSDMFPDTVYDVVWQKNDNSVQFSPTLSDTFGELPIADSTREAVNRAIDGEDLSQGALFFVVKDIANENNVSWFERDLEHLFKHGKIDFYTIRENDGRLP